MNNIKLNEIKTKFGTIYIEPLNGEREEQDRIKIFDSDKKYIDYFSVEFLEDCAMEMRSTLEEEYAARVRNIREAETIMDLVWCISTDIINWTETLLEFAAYVNAEGVTETEIYNNTIKNEFVNRIGKTYTLSREMGGKIMENLRYFEVEISNNNTVDRSVCGDESDRTILILGTREPETFEEMEEFLKKEVYPHEWKDDIRKYVVGVTETDKEGAYCYYNLEHIINPPIFK